VARDAAEDILRRYHFVDPASTVDKPVGVHALSYDKLQDRIRG